MKKLNKRYIIYPLISLFLSLFFALVVEKYLYPNEAIVYKRTFFCFFSCLVVTCGILFSFVNEKLLNSFISYIKNNKLSILYGFKYIFSFTLVLYCSVFYRNIYVLLFGVTEITIIYFLTKILYYKKKLLSIIINDILMFLFNINTLIYLFSSSFLSLIMISNLREANRLSGKGFIYVFFVLMVILFSIFIPYYKKNKVNNKNVIVIILLVIYEIILCFNFSNNNSAYVSYYKFINHSYHNMMLQYRINRLGLSKNEFLKEHVPDYIKYNQVLGEKPNVILIFTEGLSKHIVYDERNIMPNLRYYMDNESLTFSSYYNHTAATYRGIIGQLFSGYQNNELDKNNLISIEDILKQNGYYTEFINVEPDNYDFTNYLNELHFDKVINQYDDSEWIISDKEAYEQLYDRAINLNKSNKPFFLSMYTLETHISFGSYDQKFKNGKNNVLNRFYNTDYQFGEFMKKFRSSKLYDNTIIIFTSDHASFTDNDYVKTFKDVKRGYNFLDEIPLVIYHKGVNKKVIDVGGRNSIDLAPTILDYIDMDGINYFLGDSLFTTNSKSTTDTTYVENVIYFDSKDNNIVNKTYDKEITDYITKYYAVSSK